MASIVSAGTTSATALNMSADTTGILQLASNNGTVALTVDTSQNVGIGTTAPTARLFVSSAVAGYTSTLADSVTNAATLLKTNSSDSTVTSFGGITGGAGTIQRSNGSGTSSYSLLLNPFGGSVGVGTISPLALFQVDAANFGLATTYNTLTSNFAVRTTTAQAANIGGEIALGGVNGTSNQISDFARIHGKKENSTSTNVSGYFAVEVSTDAGPAPYIFERMRIVSDGSVRIAMQNYASTPSSTNYGVSLNNTGAGSRFFGQGTGTETQIEFGNTNGTRGSIQTNSTNTLYNTTSDYRLKENVVPMANALATVLALKPCTYNWKVDGSDGQGFIAHELQAVVPDCVSGEKDAVDEEGNIKPQFVDTSFLVATLTAAIQELNAKVTALENK